jgi:hypothetical protein
MPLVPVPLIVMEPPAAKLPPPERVPEMSGPVVKLNASPEKPEDEDEVADIVDPFKLTALPLAMI